MQGRKEALGLRERIIPASEMGKALDDMKKWHMFKGDLRPQALPLVGNELIAVEETVDDLERDLEVIAGDTEGDVILEPLDDGNE